MSDVKSFWSGRAADPAIDDISVTHRDVWQRWLEIEVIKRLLGPSDRVLDMGCGSGYASKLLAPQVAELVGLDFSNEMIERARQNAPANTRFAVQDVLTLSPEAHGSFDVVMTIRCLINILDAEKQRQALENIRSVLKPGGRLIFIEGSIQGRDKLNAMREQTGLPAMPPVWHNLDFDESATLAFFQGKFEIEERISFGTYDFVSRLVHPLAVRPAEPDYQGVLNEIAARLALIRNDMPDISRVFGLVLRKL